MATEYDIFSHPQLNPLIQQKLANSIQRVAKICWKMCCRDSPATEQCIENCTSSYIKTFEIILEELKKNPDKRNSPNKTT